MAACCDFGELYFADRRDAYSRAVDTKCKTCGLSASKHVIKHPHPLPDESGTPLARKLGNGDRCGAFIPDVG